LPLFVIRELPGRFFHHFVDKVVGVLPGLLVDCLFILPEKLAGIAVAYLYPDPAVAGIAKDIIDEAELRRDAL
jgi:hypothetical protein